MKRKDGIRLKIKWNRVFTPRQIFYGIQYIPNKFYDCSEAVGRVLMFIAKCVNNTVVGVRSIKTANLQR